MSGVRYALVQLAPGSRDNVTGQLTVRQPAAEQPLEIAGKQRYCLKESTGIQET